MRVMLVEDDASLAALLRTLLELDGFTVLFPTQRDLDNLLAEIQQARPDTLLLDLHLGRVSGLDLLRRLRACEAENRPSGAENTGRLRVVMTSGMAASEECLAAGADGFLPKPFMPAELIHQIKGDAA